MKKRAIVCIMMLMLTTMVSLVVNAGDQENPEIIDNSNDAHRFIDIRSVWFHENLDESHYLFITLEISNLYSSSIGAEYQVIWTYDGVKYAVHGGLDHVIFEDLGWKCGKYHLGSTNDIKEMADCEVTIDRDNGLITWKVPKDQIGNPEAGDRLTRTYAHSGFEFVVIKFFRLIPRSMDSASDLQGSKFGLDYIIQY